jgi:hypothetical protein
MAAPRRITLHSVFREHGTADFDDSGDAEGGRDVFVA